VFAIIAPVEINAFGAADGNMRRFLDVGDVALDAAICCVQAAI
jgi:hypothetical protein